MKRFIPVLFFFILCSSPFFADETVSSSDITEEENALEEVTEEVSPYKYKIDKANYHMKGSTKEIALRNKVPVDYNTLFKSKTDFEDYIENFKIQLQNQRVFKSTDVKVTYSEPSEINIISVELDIYTEDTWNLLIFPRPGASSDNGFTLKLKVKDYNSFGSMEPFDVDVGFDYTASGELELFAGFDLTVPFMLGPVYSAWNFDTELDYSFEKGFGGHIKTGCDFSLPLEITSLNFSVKQGFDYNPDYKATGDACYFTEEASMSMPFTIGKLGNWSAISWTPSLSFKWRWDKDIFTTDIPSGIEHSDLRSPVLSFCNSVGFGRVDWIENFRQGFSFSASQSVSYNFHDYNKSQTSSISQLSTSFDVTAKGFLSTKYVGFNSKINFFSYLNTSRDVTDNIRGVRDYDYDFRSGIIANFDMPIHLFDVNISEWFEGGNWFTNFLRKLDFEVQVSPFIDVAIGDNLIAGSFYDYKDGVYAGGIEILGFLKKARSIQGRFSVGVDLGRTIFPKKFINLDWRTGSRWEYYLGFSLSY